MTTLVKKVCIIGDFAVGKTSIIARFVYSIFSDKYLTTVGVKIDTKKVPLSKDNEVKLVLWDVAGTDRFSAIEFSYVRGAAGYLLVADGTRAHTLETALRLRSEIEQRYGALPFALLINKNDLEDDWEITDDATQALHDDGHPVFTTSAKTGDNVEEAISELARRVSA